MQTELESPIYLSHSYERCDATDGLSPSLLAHPSEGQTTVPIFPSVLYVLRSSWDIQTNSMLNHQSKNQPTSARRSRLHPIHLAARVQAS